MELSDPEFYDESVPTVPQLPCKAEDIGTPGLYLVGDMTEFWYASRPWLASQGFNLWDMRPRGPENEWYRDVWLCPSTVAAATVSLPYSVSLSQGDTTPGFIPAPNLRFGYAQDREGRDVMFKLVDKGSAEHTINQLLHQKTKSAIPDEESFPGVLCPIAVLDTPHEYSFVVMPMWGSPVHVEDLELCGEILQAMRCLLRGLAFLHKHRIVHRDIGDHNVVVNVHSPGIVYEEYRELLQGHRRSHEVLYALMDFDQSLQLPANTSLQDCRRLAEEDHFGWPMYKPADNRLGQPYYNPFAFDVGMLGRFFQYHFAEAVVHVPGLAALFDGMTDHSIPRRLTAEQASAFFDSIVASLPHDVFKTPVTLERAFEPLNNTEHYWRKLSADAMSVWGKYRRAPSRTILQRIVGWVTSYPLGFRAVCSIRWILQL